jgi:peptide/nickel transport system permease protein
MNAKALLERPWAVRLLGGETNRRKRTLILVSLLAAFLVFIVVGGALLGQSGLNTNVEEKNLAPSLRYPFGTDWLGRNMLTRTLKGLTMSMGVGLLASSISACIAVLLGLAAATMPRAVDAFISWLIDLFLSMPHLVMLILVAFILGGGAKGVILAVAVTHWPSLARVVRAEVLQLRHSDYVRFAQHAGRSRLWIAARHMLPHLLPQVLVGYILLFPHAILHEASITFLGFGLSPHKPAIGVILSESMRYLSTGRWWLAFFPGLSLLALVFAFYSLGSNLRMLADPWSSHE